MKFQTLSYLMPMIELEWEYILYQLIYCPPPPPPRNQKWKDASPGG